jgi:pSer/pThr/pTyr-binding forkhead associated (FHA) protein
MDVRLVVRKGADSERVVRLKSEETIVGRRKDCDLKIRSADVSRRHCLLSYQDGVLLVEDLDSVNGTFLNGQRVTGRQAVRPGDELEIGPICFVVEYQLSRAAAGRLREETEALPAAVEEVDELPVVEEAAGEESFTFGGEEELDALPITDEDTEFAQQATQGKAPPNADDDDEAIPVADELLEGNDWHLPANGDLRDILTEMDEPKGKKRPKTKE